jgi:SAM-dependent methyltransferase
VNNYDIETDEYLAHGLKLFVSTRYGKTEKEHAEKYHQLVGFKKNSVIVDMGCGIGEMGRLLQECDGTLKIINVTNSPRQHEIIKQYGGHCVLADFNSTDMPSGIAQYVMFNESFGYGNPEQLLQEASRLLSVGGCVVLRDFVPHTPLKQVHVATWDYTGYPVHEVVAAAAQAGLALQWMERPKCFYDHFQKFFQDSAKMQEWHSGDYQTYGYPYLAALEKYEQQL